MDAGRERDLVERCRRGDEGAFQELVDEYKGLVFALIARTIPDRSRVEDVGQDVFLRDLSRPAVFPWRVATLDLDLPDRRERLCAGAEPASGAGLDGRRTSTRGCSPAAADRQFSDLELRERLEKAVAQASGQLSPARRRALPGGRAVRRPGGSARASARDGQDPAVPRETAAAPNPGVGVQVGAAGERQVLRSGRRAARTDCRRRSEPDEGVSRHLASCMHCAEALAAAERVDRAAPRRGPCPRTLEPIYDPHPGADPPRPLAREQFLDAGFNVAIAAVIARRRPGRCG